MIAGADREDPQPIKPNAGRDRAPGNAGPDRREADEMDDDEGNSGRINDVVVTAVRGRLMLWVHLCLFDQQVPTRSRGLLERITHHV